MVSSPKSASVAFEVCPVSAVRGVHQLRFDLYVLLCFVSYAEANRSISFYRFFSSDPCRTSREDVLILPGFQNEKHSRSQKSGVGVVGTHSAHDDALT